MRLSLSSLGRVGALCLVSGLTACAGAPEVKVLPIGAVQGSGIVSPMRGQTVVVDGVVTAAFDVGLGGFFVQSAPGADDGDTNTSDGLFVQTADGASRFPVGQRLRDRKSTRLNSSH